MGQHSEIHSVENQKVKKTKGRLKDSQPYFEAKGGKGVVVF